MAYEVEYVGSPLGTLMFAPKGVTKAPGIVLLHGSNGQNAGWSYLEAFDFAAAGFIAMPLGYDKGGTPWIAGDIHDVELGETADAIAALRADKRINGKVGLWGVSRGAEHALLVASLTGRDPSEADAIPDAVAVHAPTDTIVGAFIADCWHPRIKAPSDETRLAWQWRGVAAGLAPDAPIEIERYAGPLHITHGEEDEVWSVERTKRLEARLLAAGRQPIVHYYPYQGHTLYGKDANIDRERRKAFFATHLGDPVS